jgi:hypothetical protein
MSQLLMVFALSVLLSWGPMFIPLMASLINAIVHGVKNAGGIGKAIRLRRPVLHPAV